MRKKFSEIIPFALMMLVAVIGILIAAAIYRNYEVIEDGILGLSIFYLIYQLYFSPTRKVNQNNDLLLKFPRDLKYFPFAFLWAIILT
jgi:hypothetical protein